MCHLTVLLFVCLFLILHLLRVWLGEMLFPPPMARGGCRQVGLELSVRPGPAPCTQKQLPSVSGGRQSLSRREGESRGRSGWDGGVRRHRGGTGSPPLIPGTPSPAGPEPRAASPWVTFLGCGPAPEHPSARPLAWVPPSDARPHPRPARHCVQVTAAQRRPPPR